MAYSYRFHIKRACSLLGTFFVMMFIAEPFYYGNMSVYLWSYLVIRVGVTSQINTPWVVSGFLIGSALGLVVAGRVQRVVGNRWTLFCGILIFNAGYFFSFFTLQVSVWMLVVTLGLELGIGCGFVNGMAVNVAIDWVPKYVGAVTGVAQSAMCVGAVIVNELTTYMTNPDNRSADFKLYGYAFFGDKDVLNRVPYLLLKIGIMSTALQVIGICMITNNDVSVEDIDDSRHDVINTTQKNTFYESTGSIQDAEKSSKSFIFPSFESQNQIKTSAVVPNSDKTDDRFLEHELSVMEVIRTPDFLSLWYTFFCGDFSYLVVNTYYKTFGQIWIKDDHFLTNVGSIILVTGIILRFIYGFLTDKFGVKNSLISLYVITTPLAVFYYLTPSAGKMMFLFVTVMYGSVNGLIYSTYTVAVIKLYGGKNFSFYYGLLMSSTILLSLLAPFVVEGILSYAGWLGLYITMAGLNLTALLAVMSGLSNTI